MSTVLILALATHTRTTHLRKTVDVYCLDAELGLQFTTDTPCPGFCTEEAYTQFQVLLLDTALIHHLGQMQGVRWCTAKGCGTKVLHQHHLLLGVTRRGGQLNGTKLTSTIMCTQTTGKEAIAIGYLHHVAGTYIAYGQDTSHTLCPVVKVVLCVCTHHRLTRCTRRSMYALNLAHGHCLQSIGILIAQVVLGGKG